MNAGLPEFMNSSTLFQVSDKVLPAVSIFQPDRLGISTALALPVASALESEKNELVGAVDETP